jgi:hypothetical protein
MVVLNVVHTLFKLFRKRRPACCCDGTLACCRWVARYHPAAPAPRTPRVRRAHRAGQRRTPCSRPVEWTPWVALIGTCFPARALRL